MQYLIGAGAFGAVLLWMGLAKVLSASGDTSIRGLNSNEPPKFNLHGPPMWLPIVIMMALAVLSLNQMEEAQSLTKSAKLFVANKEAAAHKLMTEAKLAKQSVDVERLDIKRKVKEKTARLQDAIHHIAQKELKVEEMQKIADQDSKKAAAKAAKAEKAMKEAKQMEDNANDMEAEVEMQQQELSGVKEAMRAVESEKRHLFQQELEAQNKIKAAEEVLQRKSNGKVLPKQLQSQGDLKGKANTSVEQDLYLQQWAAKEALAAARKGMKGEEQQWRMVAEAEGRAKLSEEVKEQAVRRAEAAEKRVDVAEAKIAAVEQQRRKAVAQEAEAAEKRVDVAEAKIAAVEQQRRKAVAQEAAANQKIAALTQNQKRLESEDKQIQSALKHATEKVQAAEAERKTSEVKAKKAENKISRKEAVLNKAADEVAGRLSFLQGLLMKDKGHSDDEASMEGIWDKVLDKDQDKDDA